MLSRFFSKPKPPDRAAILATVPVRNHLVMEQTTFDGKLRLSAPLNKTLVHRFFGSGASRKSFELDDLGTQVWQACDGRATVEQIVTAFAARNRVNLREAEVSVTSFLAMLIKRNLIALVGTDEARRPKPSHENRAQRRARARKGGSGG